MSATGKTDEYEWIVNVRGAQVTWQGQTFELEAVDLRDGGWIRKSEAAEECTLDHFDEAEHVAKDDVFDVLEIRNLLDVVRQWHDESDHDGALRFCAYRPCKEIGAAFAIRFD